MASSFTSTFRTLAVALALALGAAPAARAHQDDTGPTPEQFAAESARAAADLRAKLARAPGDPALWQSLMQTEAMVAGVEAQRRVEAGELTFEAARDLARQAGEAVCQEWMRLRPGDGGPHLLLAYFEPDSEHRTERILALGERFPDDSFVLERVTALLRERGDPERAEALVGGFLERHADDPAAYRLALAQARFLGNATAERELLAAWLDRRPGDTEALVGWLHTTAAARDLEETRGRIVAALSSFANGEANEAQVSVCRAVLDLARGALRELGEECLAQVARSADSAELRAATANVTVREAARRGDRDALERALEGADAEGARSLAAAYVTGLSGDGACEEKIDVLGSVWRRWHRHGPLGEMVADLLTWCHEHAAAQRLFVEIVAAADSDRLTSLLARWDPRYPNKTETHLPVRALAPLLEQRYVDSRLDPRVADALDRLYEAGHATAERLALYRKRLRAGQPPSDPRRVVSLAEAVALEGDLKSAGELLDSAVASSPGWAEPLRRLIEVRLLSGRPELARAAAERALAGEPSAEIAAEAHRGMARVALMRGELAAARDHYRRALADSNLIREVGREYLAGLAAFGAEAEAASVAAELCANSGFREPGQVVEECAGAALAEVGLMASASRQLDQALARVPGKPALFQQAARAAEAAGDVAGAERALRAAVALDPESEGAWAELGMLWMRAERAREHAAVVTEAERALGQPSMLLRYQHAKLLLAAGDPRGAAEKLLEMKRLRPDLRYLDGLLDEAYRALGEQGGNP